MILHLGQLGGTTAITAAIVAVNGLIAASMSSITYRWRYLGIACALTLSLHLIGYGLYRQPLTEDPAAALKIGIVQGEYSYPREVLGCWNRARFGRLRLRL